MSALGAKSYDLRSNGYEWAPIGRRLGTSAEYSRKAAHLHAQVNDLPWPLTATIHGDDTPEEEGVTDERINNERVLTSDTPLIKTVQELLDFCDVDMADWVFVRKEATAWTTAMKNKEGDSAFYAQNFRVYVVLAPKKPEAIHPVITPIHVTAPERPAATSKQTDYVRTLVLNDQHFGFRRRVRDAALKPFHNRAALDVAVQIAEDLQPHRIELLGDWLDMTEWTDKFLRSPEFYFTLQPALCESAFWLTQLAAICDDIRYHEGNHEVRLRNAIKKRLPFAYGLRPAHENPIEAPAVLSIANLLGLDRLGIELVNDYPNDRDWLGPRIGVRHGDVSRAAPGGQTQVLAKGYITEIVGHGHKREMSTGVREDAFGRYEVEAHSFGCLCRTDRTVPGHKINQEWSKGIGRVDVYNSGDFDIQSIGIRGEEICSAAFDGKVYTSRGRVAELYEMYPEGWKW